MSNRIYNRIIAGVLALAAGVTGAYAAGINKGFFKKAAEKAWALDSENLFVPTKIIPDSISAGYSAVVIARHDDFVGDRVEQNTIYSQTGRTNRTTLQHIRRSMVKLLDASAVERYSEFEFGSTHEKHSYGIEPIRHKDRAFGVRVYKPDGKVNTIDVSQALEVSDGKDGGKNKKFKLAVPGLEVGDVIEYFYYTEYANDEGDIELVDVALADEYPVLARLMTGRFDRTLTAELKSYNGAPMCERVSAPGDDNGVRMFIENVPAVSFRKFLFEENQLPFIRVNTINNHQVAGDLSLQPRRARGAGIYQNIDGSRIQSEALEMNGVLAQWLWHRTRPISQTPSKALKMTKNYLKNHPDATPREATDVAWLAIRYNNFTANDREATSSDILLSHFHNEVVENLNVLPREQTGIGMANSRDEVPLQEMSKWNQTTYLSVAGDAVYVMQPGYNYAPGEVPALFQGVPGVAIKGRLRDLTYADVPVPFTLPDRKYGGNKMNHTTTVTFDPDDEKRLNIHRDVVLTGSLKSVAIDFTDQNDWIAEVEDFFGIDEGKRYKDKTANVDVRRRELREAVKDESLENLGVRPDSITNFVITSRGILPGKEAMSYSMDCAVSDLVEDLGDGISLSLGRLFGRHERLGEHERERLLDAMLFSAGTETHIMTVKVPEGYKVDETSLADFNRQVANAVGQFMVQAKVNDDGDVVIQCVNRLRHHSVALQAWPMLRDLCDAAAEFADATIILTKN